MKTLLRLDSSARLAESHSRRLADHFQAGWLEKYPGGQVVTRDLAHCPPPHLDDAAIAALHAGAADASGTVSDQLVAELKAADDLLISAPLYNLGAPSTLKAYFDHVVRAGHTFAVETGVYKGLLTGRSAFIITARGGLTTPSGQDDFLTPYLENILAFIGIAPVVSVTLDGTAIAEGLDLRRQRAIASIDRLLLPRSDPEWIGDFDDDDRRAISALRTRQAEAIMRGDAGAYADLCDPGIVLLLPGRAAVSGRDRFIEIEERLFAGTEFVSFRKIPQRIERSGDLALEIGMQEVDVKNASERSDVVSARQKYLHVFRKNRDDWRFSILMSNSCEQ